MVKKQKFYRIDVEEMPEIIMAESLIEAEDKARKEITIIECDENGNVFDD